MYRKIDDDFLKEMKGLGLNVDQEGGTVTQIQEKSMQLERSSLEGGQLTETIRKQDH